MTLGGIALERLGGLDDGGSAGLALTGLPGAASRAAAADSLAGHREGASSFLATLAAPARPEVVVRGAVPETRSVNRENPTNQAPAELFDGDPLAASPAPGSAHSGVRGFVAAPFNAGAAGSSATAAGNFAAPGHAGLTGRPGGPAFTPANFLPGDAILAGNALAAPAPAPAGGPQVQPAGSIEGHTAVSVAQVAQQTPTATPPQATPEQLAETRQARENGPVPTPPVPFDPTGKVSDVPPTPPDLGQRTSFTDFALFRRTPDTVAPSLSTTGENAVGTIGRASFNAGAFYGTVSGDYGANFAYVNPFTLFPATGDYRGGYDGFQRVATDLNRGMVLWYVEYNKSGTTGSDVGGIRIAVANSANNLLDSNWFYYNWTPDQFAQGRGTYMNWPQMAVSNNYLYVTTNVFNISNNSYKSTLMWRMLLSDLQNGRTLNATYWVVTNGSSLPLSNNATTVMYSASQITSTSVRIFNQPEGSTSLNWNDKSGLAQTFSGTHTSITVGNVNWTARSDERIQTAVVFQQYVIFMWNSAQGTNRPQPFVRAEIFRTTDLVNINADLWFGSYAWQWAALDGSDSTGFSGPAYVGGPGLAPQVNILVQDLFANPLVPPPWTNFGAVGGTGAAQFGDYVGVALDSSHKGTFVASAIVMNGSSVVPYYFWYGRQGLDPHKPVPRADVGDTLAASLNTGIGPLSGTYTYSNSLWSAAFGRRDVDIYRLQANAGTMIYALAGPQSGGGDPVSTVVRLFNSSGTEVAAVDPNTTLALLQYKVTSTGTYYVGISGHGNRSYNPNTAGSGALAAVGDYQVTMLVTPVPTTSFRVTTTARNPDIAGTPFSVTVTALDSSGAVNPSYRGTVHFASADSLATLPGNYTFTASDNGVHTFTNAAVFRKEGTQSIEVADTASSFIAGASSGVIVLPAAAQRLTVTGFPSPITAGDTGYFLVSAFDAFGNPALLYNGEVQVTSSDDKAEFLPATYTFKPVVDPGYHLFFGLFKTAGSQSITVTDTANPNLTGTLSDIDVEPAAATHFHIDAPTQAASGSPFDVTVTALDAFGNVDVNYGGTVTWRTTDMDPGVVLPDPYTFVPGADGDNGVHTFSGEMTLVTTGFQLIQALDADNNSIQGLGLVQVTDAGSGVRGLASSVAPTEAGAVPGFPAVVPARSPAARLLLVPDADGLARPRTAGEEGSFSHWLARPVSEQPGVLLLDDGLVDSVHADGPAW